MKLLINANVFGLKVPVYLKKTLPDSYGYFENTPPKIYVDESLNKKDFILTFAHELVHAMCHRLNLQFSDEIEEMLADCLVVVLQENLQLSLPRPLQAAWKDSRQKKPQAS